MAVCLIAAVLCVMLASYKKEYSLIISVGVGVIAFISTLSLLSPAFTAIRDIIAKTGINSSFFTAALKALGISYVSQFIADTCRDFGQTSIAAKAEFAGRAALFVISLPLLESLLDAVANIVG